jgi:4-amino-4-deoxy-L-arabinose transferase-like glycosyltransferase
MPDEPRMERLGDLHRAGGAGAFMSLLVAAAFVAVSIPTVCRLQFFNSIEDIVIETALEARRDGHWLIPQMLGETRTRKPPLATWLAAVSTRPATVEGLSDPARREDAYKRLAWETRLPALLAAGLTVFAACELGRLLLGSTAGGVATGVVTATSMAFLDYARLAAPDTHLALWVTATNLLLARAIFRGERWVGCCGAGVCLGLAMMSKGPVALLQTLAPIFLFALFRRAGDGGNWRRWPAPAAVGAALFLAVALPWPLLMLAKVPGVTQIWLGEVTRADAADPRPDRWYASLLFARHFMPWTLWLLLGLAGVARSLRQEQRSRVELAFWLFVVPVAVMACFPERKPRYILPMIPAGAVLAAWAMIDVLDRDVVSRGLRRLYAVHWLLVGFIAVGGIVLLVRPGGLTWGIAAVISAVTIGLSAASWAVTKQRVVALVVASGLAVACFDVVHAFTIPPGDGRLSIMQPLADAIVARAGNMTVVSFYPEQPERNAPLNLSIYLNRVVKPVPSATDHGDEARVVVAGSTARARFEPPGDWAPIGGLRRSDVYWQAFLVKP